MTRVYLLLSRGLHQPLPCTKSLPPRRGRCSGPRRPSRPRPPRAPGAADGAKCPSGRGQPGCWSRSSAGLGFIQGSRRTEAAARPLSPPEGARRRGGGRRGHGAPAAPAGGSGPDVGQRPLRAGDGREEAQGPSPGLPPREGAPGGVTWSLRTDLGILGGVPYVQAADSGSARKSVGFSTGGRA